MSIEQFSMPDAGEGLTEAEIIEWKIQPGDVVHINQTIVEIETAKASVELPSPFAGIVAELHAVPGQIVPVGQVIVSIDVGEVAPVTAKSAVLVGYGVKDEDSISRRPRKKPPESHSIAPAPTTASQGRVLAKPLVRKLARERGIDLAQVTATGQHGEVTRADLLAAAPPTTGDHYEQHEQHEQPEQPEQPEHHIAVRGVQRAMAKAMTQSAFTAPHVSEWVEVDVSRTLAIAAALQEKSGIRITPTVIVAAALVRASAQYPLLNSSWVDLDAHSGDSDSAEIVLHPYVNLGVAVDSPQGLLVPVVRNAQADNYSELATAITAIVTRARNGQASPADLTGGTIALTNIGVFGIDGGTPILPPGNSAILAMGRIVDKPWAIDGAVVIRPIMQLTLSFDHRILDGATASRALRSIADYVSDPAVAEILLRS